MEKMYELFTWCRKLYFITREMIIILRNTKIENAFQV